MKHLFVIVLCFAPAFLFAQSDKHVKGNLSERKKTNPQKAAKKFEPIQLWFVMLTKGANRSQDSVTAAKLQEGHMANISKLSETGKLLVAGPFMEDANWRGIFILKSDFFVFRFDISI